MKFVVLAHLGGTALYAGVAIAIALTGVMIFFARIAGRDTQEEQPPPDHGD